MSPERDSQSRKNDDSADSSRSERDGKSESDEDLKSATPERIEKTYHNSKPNSRYSATEMGKRARSLGSLGMIPVLLAVGPIIGMFIGQWLDKTFGTTPWLTALFVVLGFVAVIREMIQLLKRYSDEDRSDKSYSATDNKAKDNKSDDDS